MTANPLVNASNPRGVTPDRLFELAESLNRCAFVIDSGLPYFVGQLPDGKHCLDRRLTFKAA